jgi:hypothetical protein
MKAQNPGLQSKCDLKTRRKAGQGATLAAQTARIGSRLAADVSPSLSAAQTGESSVCAQVCVAQRLPAAWASSACAGQALLNLACGLVSYPDRCLPAQCRQHPDRPIHAQQSGSLWLPCQTHQTPSNMSSPINLVEIVAPINPA